MNMKLVEEVTSKQIKKNIPNFSSGDTVKVHVRILENGKERVQIFEGLVVARRGSGISETFTVRKVSSAVGVERVFQLHSPLVARIEVLKRGDVRRSKLFYLRKRSGKGAKIAEDRKLTAQSLNENTLSAEELAKEKAEEAAAKKAAHEEAKQVTISSGAKTAARKIKVAAPAAGAAAPATPKK